jgi:hypothetical protein
MKIIMQRSISVLTMMIVAGFALIIFPNAVGAQQFIEPTSPLGGNAAAPLNGGATTQRKLGSLIIGSNTTTSYLCLNTDSVLTTDPTKCISSWSQLRGNYVTLAQTDLSSVSFPSLSDHVVATGRTADIGFARLQADGTKNQLYSLILEATGSAVQPATALYATDGGVTSNYAAAFNGGVYVGDGTSGSAKKFCLNGNFTVDTNVSSGTYGKGCITSWSQLSTFLSSQSYVLLQSTTGTLVPQSGRVAVSGSAIFATDDRTGLIIGTPPAGTSISVSCGDAMCNGTETANSCAIDCDQSAPANITSLSFTSASNRVTFTWVNPGDADFAGVKIIRTRGIVPTGPNDPTAETSNTVLKPTATFQTSTLSTGVSYYYGFYTYDQYGNYSSGVTQGVRLGGGTGCTPGLDCGPGGTSD